MARRDRIARYKSGVVSCLNVVAPPGEACWVLTPDAYAWFTRRGALATNWRNEVTLESMEKMQEFDPLSLIHLISPIPLLLVIAEGDTLLPRHLLVAAYERARAPKSLVVLPCGHFDIYGGPWGEQAADAAVEWFGKPLVTA
jgi:fermentation-respiration switch protein FrsA (DUF1100 family)